MAYTLYNSDGSVIAIIADGAVDQFSTSLALVGKNLNSYGQYVNENFIKVLSNGASSSINIPLNPIPGQLWYNTSNSLLNVYDSVLGWRTVATGAPIQPNMPSNLAIGDLWFDTTNKQLTIKINASSSTWVIGPAFSSIVGDNGWIIPTLGVKNNSGNVQQTTVLKNYGQVIGTISNQEFNLTPADSLIYFNTSTTSTIVAGLTINGDISYTGKLVNKYLSASFNLQEIYNSLDRGAESWSPYDYRQVMLDQNPQIVNFLTQMFPPNGGTLETLTGESGVPVGSEARVICTSPANQNPPTYFNDIQVRRFHIISDPAGIRWQPMTVYRITEYTSLINIVPKIGTSSTSMTSVPF